MSVHRGGVLGGRANDLLLPADECDEQFVSLGQRRQSAIMLAI